MVFSRELLMLWRQRLGLKLVMGEGQWSSGGQ